MQGSVAQVVVLASYGNAFLRGSTSFERNFYPSNSTFKFCENIDFVRIQRDGEQWKETPFAADPIAWFEAIRNEGVTGLRMVYGPSGEKKVSDRMMVGFVGGGGRWLIEAVGSGSSDWWEARWQVGDRNRDDKRIWRVTYGRIAVGQPLRSEPVESLSRLHEELGNCLRAIAEFAHSQSLDEFAKAFESGLARLSSGTPYDGLYHSDIAPVHSLPLSAHQLLGAAQAAWVFGGMGSWNDMGFDGEIQTRYDELSEQLYQLLNRAVVAATNSGIPPQHRKRSWQFWN
ncbi:MAG TPA: hypothetical protein VFO39_22950 [Candidatus Sulfotelmatobacter sp.]|nr:hypothetical protein [Candidatus Sulfotelmatobacter sp.]